ncbi:MAG: S8 family peptidase [Desmonostoc geniculatum HA4340-LM1]|jgi:serine protease|nr:S8 family peptidase [Desmonostoc geniculatum HA4340-LM1]
MLIKIMRYLGVFILGICLVIYLQVLSNAQQLVSIHQEGYQGIITQEDYQEILVDFSESKLPSIADIDSWVQQLFTEHQIQDAPQLSNFLSDDHVYRIKGGLKLLNRLLSDIEFKQYTECIEPNYIYRKASVFPNDPDFSVQWNLKKEFPGINVEKAWAKTRGKAVKVGVLDSGINPKADFELTEILLPSYDFVDNRKIINQKEFQDQDRDNHGTHIAGIIAQSTNNELGVAGIAYEAALLPLRVLNNNGKAYALDIAAAIRVAVDNGADVINLSLEGEHNSSTIKEAVDYAYKKGVVIVAAAGNGGVNTPSYPANYKHVIGVAAYDSTGSEADYSNYGNWVDIYAPGGSMSENQCKTLTSNGFSSGIVQMISKLTLKGFIGELKGCQGTSQAAAHVSGVAALVKSVLNESPFYNFFHNSVDEVTSIIKESARRVNGIRLLDGGATNEMLLLDAGKAVEDAWKKVHPRFPVLSVQIITEWLTKNRDWLIPVGIGSGLTIWGIFGSYKLISGVLMTLVGGLWSLNQAIHTSNLLLQVVLILPLAIVPPVLIIFITGNSHLKWLSFGTGIGAVVVLAGAATQPNLGIGLQIFSGICAFLLGLLVLLAMKDEE